MASDGLGRGRMGGMFTRAGGETPRLAGNCELLSIDTWRGLARFNKGGRC